MNVHIRRKIWINIRGEIERDKMLEFKVCEGRKGRDVDSSAARSRPPTTKKRWPPAVSVAGATRPALVVGVRRGGKLVL